MRVSNREMLRQRLPLARQITRQYATYVQEHDYTVKPSTYAYTTEDNQELFERFPLITRKHRPRGQRPRKVRMLARDFIDDSMYNPSYGYFSRSAEIFSPERKFAVQDMINLDQFMDTWAGEYRRQQLVPQKNAVPVQPGVRPSAQPVPTISGQSPKPAKTKSAVPKDKNMKTTRVSRQLWHTPSELFSPHYGDALCRYMVSQLPPGEPLAIYETGAGNGTLMVDVLNCLQREFPDIYVRSTYHIIEISGPLALKQRAHSAGHADRIFVHHRSIFDWDTVVSGHCFFIAMEVWDNLAHDVVRYDNTTGKPYQGYVVTDGAGDFAEVFSPKLDKLAAQFLEARAQLEFKPQPRLGWHPLSQPKVLRNFRNRVLPFKGNLSPPEYIPTKFFKLLHILHDYFPQHKLLGSDFTHFPERIEGYQSPVVQTFVEDTPITVSTYMVLQGYFDIMFPTDFRLAAQLYEHVIGRPAQYEQHGAFLRPWAHHDTDTKTGESPMLEFYRNAAFLYS